MHLGNLLATKALGGFFLGTPHSFATNFQQEASKNHCRTDKKYTFFHQGNHLIVQL